MPSIDEAMARSLRGSAWEIVKDKFVRTITSDLIRRDMIADAAQTTDEISATSETFASAFSSWDNCMNVVWCKCVYIPSQFQALFTNNLQVASDWCHDYRRSYHF